MTQGRFRRGPDPAIRNLLAIFRNGANEMTKSMKKWFSRPLVLAGLAATVALAGGGKVQADETSIVRPATVGTSTGNATTVSPVSLTSAATGFSNQYINNTSTNTFGVPGV